MFIVFDVLYAENCVCQWHIGFRFVMRSLIVKLSRIEQYASIHICNVKMPMSAVGWFNGRFYFNHSVVDLIDSCRTAYASMKMNEWMNEIKNEKHGTQIICFYTLHETREQFVCCFSFLFLFLCPPRSGELVLIFAHLETGWW